MRGYSLSHLSDHDLLRGLASLVAQDCITTGELLAHVAEVDSRKLYLPAAYPSMFAYCVHELHLSEDSAYRRIAAARVARQFPVAFEAVADGRLSLTAIGLLSTYLRPENADELFKAASHKTKSEIEELLAQRFPRSEMLPLVMTSSCQLVPERVQVKSQGAELAPVRVEAMTPRSSVAPIAAQRFELHLSMGQSTRDKLQYIQSLLGPEDDASDLAEIVDRSFDAYIVTLEKRKFAATARPEKQPRPTAVRRHIPAHVKRTVWERDGGRCTFASEAGRRCPSRTGLEFDHIEEVARGGTASVEGIRLRCRAHNQFTAECTFGADFMRHKRHEAQERAAAVRKAKAEQQAQAARSAAEQQEQDVVPWLRQLGFNAREARSAAALCLDIPDAPLEQRVRVALRYFHPRVVSPCP
jgi:hypothetical protein